MQKRNQVILAALAASLVVVGLWCNVIRYQQANLESLAARKVAAEGGLLRLQNSMTTARIIITNLVMVSNELAMAEADMASGDVYAFMLRSIQTFGRSYSVDLYQFSAGAVQKPLDLLPRFPYQQATVTVGGTARYEDLGRFVADFENRYPGCQLLNLDLTISPASKSQEEENHKLLFRMDVIFPVKSAGAPRVSRTTAR